MSNNSTKSPALQSEAETAVRLLDDWFDPIEAGLRGRVREFIQAMIESELEALLEAASFDIPATPWRVLAGDAHPIALRQWGVQSVCFG
jgi:hypothetical protein